MEQPRLETIPLKAPEVIPSGSSAIEKKVPSPPVAKRAVIGLIALLGLAGGLGGWHYWRSMKLAETGDSAAELEVLDAVAQMFDGETNEAVPSGTGNSPVAASVPGGATRTTVRKGEVHSATDERGEQPAVWLTGTIEVDDDEPTIIPAKVSVGSDDSLPRR